MAAKKRKTTIEPFATIGKTKPMKRGDHSSGMRDVQKFLERFGYLASDSCEEGTLDTATATALKAYQKQSHIRQSGRLDDRTIAAMTSHRCALPDMDSGVAFVARCAWDRVHLTFAFDNGTDDINGDGDFDAVRRSFKTWEAVTPLTFTEVELNQSPDIIVDWRPSDDPDHDMTGGTLAHADFPPGCGVVTSPDQPPKPLHFDDEEHVWSIGARSGAFDIETVSLHEVGHLIGLQHTSVRSAVMFASVTSNATNRDLHQDDIDGAQALYPDPNPLPAGTYTIEQRSSGRFLDAHIGRNDHSAVTRTAQNDDSQRWVLSPVAGIFLMQQRATRRFADAYTGSNDRSAVTRTAQHNGTQHWVFTADPTLPGTYTIQHLVNGRFLDAHIGGNDHSAVTRTASNDDDQRWAICDHGDGLVSLRQRSSGRFLDAHLGRNDFSMVTRPAQDDDSQRWILTNIGAVYEIRQAATGRLLDAFLSGSDHSAVTRPMQHNDTQRWALLPTLDGSFTLQQVRTGRYLDAHIGRDDHSAVTRTRQGDDDQRWVFTAV